MQQLKITPSVTVRSQTVNQYLADINRYPMASPEEETELAYRASKGDTEALQRLVEANLRFVVSVAKQYQGHGLDLPDLINEGNLGLMKAASKFDPTRGFKFISYAVWWIRQSILQGLSDQARMVRLPLNQVSNLNRITKARGAFLQDNGREPTDEELAPLVDLTPAKLAEAIRSSGPHLSFDTPFGEEGDGTLLDVIPDSSIPETDAPLRDESLRTDLEEAMKVLAPREREILKLAFGIGCREQTLEEIGETYHLTRERVRQLKEKAIRKMSRPKVRERLVQYR
ncbi:MAG: RNA polymerase sigma factor RpoD/SigA [Bacteroidales bacterium]|nr:RNA polymerase sigma factor RpoD/SigA [Bacteroidales bacterium]